MRYRTLGRSGIRVSEIGLGCEHLQGKDFPVVKAAVDEALALGVSIFDVFMSEPNRPIRTRRAVTVCYVLVFCSITTSSDYSLILRSSPFSNVKFASPLLKTAHPCTACEKSPLPRG